MNPRLVLHLFATDWRRLRWFLLLAWLGMLLSALPVLRFNLAEFQSNIWSGLSSGSYNEEEGKALSQLIHSGRRPISSPWSHYAAWFLPLLLAGISASLGFHGSGWARVRPLRWRERALAALLGLLAFIVLPQCAVIAANILAHGFSTGEALSGVLRAGSLLLPLHACSLVLGRVCGSLWRWIAAIAGISVITGLLSLLPYVPYWWSKTGLFSIGWWGELPNQSRPILVTLAVMVLLVFLFRGGDRPRWRMALVLLSVVLAPLLVWLSQGGPGYSPAALGDVPRHPQASSIRAEYVTDSLFRHQTYEEKKTTTLEANLSTIGLPEDEEMMWVLEKAGPFSHAGRTVPQKWGWFPVWRGRDVAPGGLPMQPDDVAPLPFKVGTSNRDWSSMTKRWLIGEFNLAAVAGAGPQLDMDAGVLGIAMRQREVLRAPLQDVIDLEGAGLKGGRAHLIRSGILAPAVDMSYFLASPQKGNQPYADGDPMKRLRCFLYLGMDRYVEGRDLHQGARRLLSQASAIRRIVKFDGVKEEELADAQLVLVRLEITGSVRTRVTAHNLALPPARDFRGRRERSDLIGPSRDPWGHADGRPSPESCTEDQAGQWFMQVLNTHDRSGGRELAPFVKRFPGMFLNYPTQRYWTEPVSDAILKGLPEGQRQDLLDAFAKDTDPGTSQLLPVILQRGWQAECRETVLRGLRDKPTDNLVFAVASYEDPSLYPLLLDAVDKMHSIRAYLAIRRLPGIEPALTRMVQAGFARDRAAFIADPDSREEAPKLAVPAAHGLREAFDLLVPPSKKRSDKNFPAALDVLAQTVSTPAEVTTWQARMDYLNAREAADFHYDSFAGFWFPNNSKHSAK